MNESARDKLIAIYVEYRNYYLTPEGYADVNGLTREQARTLIDLAREVATTDHPEA